MKTPTLSIIVPCFNSERTVDEAVDSIFRQEINIPFEVIVIDDGSTDETSFRLLALKKKYPNISLISHMTNMGGGKSRNDAIRRSHGDMIFCLDSDDILPDKMLPRLIFTLRQRKCDGVIFSAAKYFMWTKHFSKTQEGMLDPEKNLQIDDLFSENNSFLTQVNFLYTRKSFELTGGYPESHGFDTQGFGFKFLAKGNSVYTCPDSFYFHRQGVGKSYFEREYEKGRLSLNQFLIFEDSLYVFSDDIVQALFKFNVFKYCSLTSDNLMTLIRSKFAAQGHKIFSNSNSWKKRLAEVKVRKIETIADLELLGTYEILTGNFQKAIVYFQEILSKGEDSPLIFFNLNRCLTELSPNNPSLTVEKELSSITLQPKVSFVSQPLPIKLFRLLWHSITSHL